MSRTVAFLPLSQPYALDAAESFDELVQEAVRATEDGLAIVFYRPSRFKDNPVQRLSPAGQKSDWDILQRFLGIVYGVAGREAAKLDRPLLDVIVLVEGLLGKMPLDDEISKLLMVDGESTDETARFFGHAHKLPMVTNFNRPLRQNVQSTAALGTVPLTEEAVQDRRHNVTALGGTFDHLHGGHKILLTMAVAITNRRLIIGLTVDVMLKSKAHGDLLEPYDRRKKNLEAFLSYLSADIHFDIVALNDPYGPTASDEAISALTVSRESAAGGLAIDEIREKKGLRKLRTYIIDVISGDVGPDGTQAEDGDKPLLMESSATAKQLKELKLGSTYIRQWLAKKKEMPDSPQPAHLMDPTRKGPQSTSLPKRRKTSPSDKPSESAKVDPVRTAYEATSQRTRWTYSGEELQRMRRNLNEGAVKQGRQNWDMEITLAAEEGNPKPKVPRAFPGFEEEQLLVAFYASSISTIIAGGGLNSGRPIPSTIEGVAITFLKRFYLRTSVLDWHPKVIMLVCLFLAGKVCNHVFEIDNYVASFKKIERDDILGPEYLVLQTLRFDMYVPRVQDALHGWFLKLQDANPSSMNRIEAAYFVAQSNLKRSRLSDVEFLYTPAQIAATCFRMADSKLFQVAMDQLLPRESKPEVLGESNRDSQLLTRERLLEILDRIQSMIEATPSEGSFNMEKVKAADKMVKSAQDPARNNSSALYRQQQRQYAAQQAENRAIRLRRAQQDSKDRDDFFGAPVATGLTKNETSTAPGVKADGGGLMFGGDGLKMVGMELDSSDSE